MKNIVILSAIAVVLGLGAATSPASALPSPSGVSAGQGGLVHEARMSRRHRMHRSRSQAGNANMPSRRPAARQYGQTSGGPRR